MTLPAVPARTAVFELERFAWAAPDRLEVLGTFQGLHDPPSKPPALIVGGTGRTHRLPAIPDCVSGPAENGRRWQAAFAWQEAPEVFGTAELQLDAGTVVELPEPRRRGFRGQILEVRRVSAELDEGIEDALDGDAPGAKAVIERSDAPDPDVPAHEEPSADTVAAYKKELLALRVEMIAAQDEVEQIRAAWGQDEDELEHARADLQRERERHLADAKRFRELLATIRGSAEAARAVEQSTKERLAAQLQEAHDTITAKDAALREVRSELDAAVAAREQAHSDAAERLSNARRAATDAGAGAEHMLRALRSLLETLGDGKSAV